MAITGSYFLDTIDFSAATAVFTDINLTTKALDGHYSFNGSVRQQVSGLLNAIMVCPTGMTLTNYFTLNYDTSCLSACTPTLDCSFTVSAQEVQTVTFDQELYIESDGTLYGTLTVVRPVRFKVFAELFNPGNAQITFFCTGFAPTIGIINNDEYTVAYSNPSSIVTAGTYNYEMIVNIAPDNGFTAGCGVTYEEA